MALDHPQAVERIAVLDIAPTANFDPATRHAICEDYRAAATIDLDHDAADADRRIAAPLLALWGAKGTVGQLYDVLETWREKALDVRGRALDCGHTLQEEAPQETLRELLGFLA